MRRLFTSLMLLVFFITSMPMLAAVGDEIKSPDNIVSGKWYYIKGVYTSNKTDVACYYNAPDAAGKYTGNAAASIDDATPFKFTKVENGWTLTSVNGFYLRPHTSTGQTYLVKEEIVLGIASGKTKEGEDKGIKIGPYSDYYLQSNTSTAKIGAYKATQYDVTLIEAPEPTVKTETSLSYGKTTEYTVNIGEEFDAPSLSISPAAIASSVTYSSSNTDVATISSTGVVELTGATGSATITAKFDGDDDYDKSSASYVVNVVDPSIKKATFEFGANKYEWEYTNDGSIYFDGSDYNAKEGEISAGFSGKVRLWSSNSGYTMRFYSDDTYGRGQMTLTADEGYVITQVVVSGSTLSFQLPEGAEGSLTGGTWTGEANSVVLQKGPSTSNFTTVDVYYKEKTAPEPKTYSLVGYINGADYGCESDWENPGEYIFDEDGKLTVKFDQDSYVFVKTTDNSNWYLTESYVPCGEAGAQVTATMVNGKNYGEKMQVPGGYDIELTLTEKEDNTIELTYTMPTPPTEMVLVESELNDKIIEGGLIWNGLDADGNHVYVAVDAEGKLSTGYTEMILKGQPLYRATDGTATITTNEDGSKTLDATVTFNEIGTYHITGTYAPTEMVLSNNEIKESPSSSAITWEGRDADGNYVSVAVDAEGKLSVGSTAIFTYDFSAMYEATDGTATITTNEDGSKSLDATITFEEIGTYHITGTIAAPVPCPFGLPTVTATTEDITFVFDLTDAVEGKDNPELEATIVVKKGEMEYTGGISEEDVVDGKVIKTISNSIFSAGFSSLTLEAGDEIVVTFPEATIWEKVDGSWNKAWTGEVEGSVNVTVAVPEPTEKPLTNCGIIDNTSIGGPITFGGKDSDKNNVTVAINPDGTLDMDITAIMLADLSANITAESGTGTITTNADGTKSLDATVKFKDGNTYHITGTIVPIEMVLSNNEIKENTSGLTWEGRDADGNYVSVAVDAEGKLSVGSTAIFTYDFSAMYKATDGTATITTNEDGSKSLDATITFEEIGTYHITGTIAAPAPCPFGLPTVTATTEGITFEFDLTDAVKGKDTPQFDVTIVVKKGEMEYTGGISEEDVVDGKVIKTISNSIFSAGFSSLALEAGDEIVVTFPEATLWETVEGKWNKAWTGEVEGSVQATVTAASGIKTLSSASDDAVKYNLAGQRVKNAKGIIIVNGKKVAVK